MKHQYIEKIEVKSSQNFLTISLIPQNKKNHLQNQKLALR